MRKYLFVYLNFCNFAKYLVIFDFFSLLAKLYLDRDKYSMICVICL